MEARIARIESDVAHMRTDIADIKVDLRSVRDKLDSTAERARGAPCHFQPGGVSAGIPLKMASTACTSPP